MMQPEKCGYVAIIGRPNVGKSTLLNCIIKRKISITSPKPQTTRAQILGINTVGPVQAVYIDTPGIHASQQRAMNRYLNRLAGSVMPDADVIVFMVEPRWHAEDELVLEKLKQSGTQAPVILVINKIDRLKNKQELLPIIDEFKSKYDFAQIIPLSALRADNVSALEKEIMNLLPENPHFFPDDQVTDKSDRFRVAELIREKLIQATEQEIPYSTTVEIESFDEQPTIIKIGAIIWVERPGQKAIVIGTAGERLKKIGTLARKDMEKLLGKKVFLRLWVKVKESWTDDDRALKSLGFD
jgi:GTP-binding protein Era